MSATGRPDTIRDPRDFYRTPAWVTQAIMPYLPSAGRVIDPGCGDGAITKELLLASGRYDHVAVELDPDLAVSAVDSLLGTGVHVFSDDFLQTPAMTAWGLKAFDLAVGNPPYSKAMEFVLQALRVVHPQGTVAMLLRLNWLAGQKRRDFHIAHPADVYVLSKRPSFTGDGKTDATEYAWFVWNKQASGRLVHL